MRILLHSFVDVITNSSTTIYVWQEGAIGAVKEVINEVLELMGEAKQADELFTFGVFCDEYEYFESVEEDSETARLMKDEDKEFYDLIFKEDDYKPIKPALAEMKAAIMRGERSKPKWMASAEEDNGWSGYSPSRYLEILAKEPRYEGLVKKLVKFLNSPESDGARDG